MGNGLLHELCKQRDLAIAQIRAAASNGDDELVDALTERLADLRDIATRHGLPA